MGATGRDRRKFEAGFVTPDADVIGQLMEFMELETSNLNPETAAMDSMTGYGRGEAVNGVLKFVVELSAVNRKQTEIVVNLPRKLIQLEAQVRKAVAGRISRGRISAQISVESTQVSHGVLEADEQLAGQYRDALEGLSRALGQPFDLTATDLIRAPGVFSVLEVELEMESAWPVLEEALGRALDDLASMQEREGEHLREDLRERLRSVEKHIGFVKELSSQVVKNYRLNMERRLRESGLQIPLDDERLVREIGIFAERCDITEEITRLESHLKQFSRYLESDEPVGRAMDFLSQELFRELNTIGSKANNASIAQHVVDSKTELEKIREQVQNVQ